MPRKPNNPSVVTASNLVKVGCPEPVMTEQIIHAHKKKRKTKKRMVAVRRSTRLLSVVAPSPSGVKDVVEQPIPLSESENEEEQYACPDKTVKSPARDNLEEDVNHMDNETVLEDDVNRMDNETVLEEDANHMDNDTVLEKDVNHMDNETVLEEDANHMDNEIVLEGVNHMDHKQFKSKGIKRSYPDENPIADMSYKSLYIDSLKQVEALKEENAALAKRLDFSLGKIEAYESLKDTMMHLKDIVLVSSIGRATEAAINMASQGTLSKAPLPGTPNGAA